jgi:hypothetical protein
MFRDDYLMRMIEQLAAAIARIAGLNRGGQHEEALAAADAAWGELLGDIPLELAGAVDSRTLAGMLRRPDKIRLAAAILREQAHALAGLGDPLSAARRSRRALELLLEARALAAEPGEPTGAGTEDAAAALRELARSVPHDALAARYRAMLPADG